MADRCPFLDIINSNGFHIKAKTFNNFDLYIRLSLKL